MLLYVAVQLWILLPQSGLAQSDSVDQSPPEVRLSEGQSVTLHCNFTTLDTSPYLFWYQQYPNQSPQHIVTKTTFDATDQALVQGKFSASLYMGNRTVPFQIEAVSHQESAVYYCALRPTVGEKCITALQKLSGRHRLFQQLFWFYQYPNQPPQHLLTEYQSLAEKNIFTSGNFSAVLFSSNKTVLLNIEAVSLQNRAMYHCALRSTLGRSCISGNTRCDQGAPTHRGCQRLFFYSNLFMKLLCQVQFLLLFPNPMPLSLL
ncbi:uncharacterized protein LOC115642294 [Gopherus evgoodei]|uniref:uncharacterized protein LOC115642294 n=1 Tax=Gopherus evgoodei TaxID=1825980 RepID=UPI0011CF7FC4|nr:uncharacterized protein LOC115642294 [Gopherus evgoodei]